MQHADRKNSIRPQGLSHARWVQVGFRLGEKGKKFIDERHRAKRDYLRKCSIVPSAVIILGEGGTMLPPQQCLCGWPINAPLTQSSTPTNMRKKACITTFNLTVFSLRPLCVLRVSSLCQGHACPPQQAFLRTLLAPMFRKTRGITSLKGKRMALLAGGHRWAISGQRGHRTDLSQRNESFIRKGVPSYTPETYLQHTRNTNARDCKDGRKAMRKQGENKAKGEFWVGETREARHKETLEARQSQREGRNGD